PRRVTESSEKQGLRIDHARPEPRKTMSQSRPLLPDDEKPPHPNPDPAHPGAVIDMEIAQQRLEHLQSELLHLSRVNTIGQMVSSLAHELNQPLTAISNYVEGCRLLLERPSDANLQICRDTMSLVSEQTHRAANIIRRLRGFMSRGENQRRPE